MAFIEQGEVQIKQLEPLDYGFERCTEEDLLISGPDQGCSVLKELLQGQGPKPMADMLAFNVGLGLFLLNKGQNPQATSQANLQFNPQANLHTCMEEAKQAVASGVAKGFVNA